MNRNLFFNQETVGGIQELDFMDESLVGFNFQMNREPAYYRVTQADLLRPDSIAYAFYSQERLWWVVCYVNKIYDVMNDMKEGMILTIPNLYDIYDYFKQKRKR